MLLMVCWCVATAAAVSAQSGSRSSSGRATVMSGARPLLAEPKPANASPFLPPARRDVRLPVAIDGFCVVTLRDQQEWKRGSEVYQHTFDGQLYWFVGRREQAIFAANPRRYAPALGGDCVVTYAEKGVRVPGRPQHGILHDHRLYFFSSSDALEKFRSQPETFIDADLANGGQCVVSKIDDQKETGGLTETTVIVQGMRYQFANANRQRRFMQNLVRYGVEPPVARRITLGRDQQSLAPPPVLAPGDGLPNAVASQNKTENQPLPKKILNKAMGGYCPVSIRTQDVWVEGDARYREVFDGRTYLMAGEQELALFRENPAVYIPALGGDCVVTEVNENRRVPGSIYHAAFHEGQDRLFLFTGVKQKQAFDEAPEKFLDVDLAAEGFCVVTLVEERKRVKGLSEFLTWHEGKRYFFASAENQEKFRENLQLYAEL